MNSIVAPLWALKFAKDWVFFNFQKLKRHDFRKKCIRMHQGRLSLVKITLF